MQELMEKARRLGEEIAAHERTRSFVSAAQAVRTDAAASGLLREFEAQSERMAKLEQAQKPIEVEDKRALADLHGRLTGNALVKELMRRQADYFELMTGVNRAIQEPLIAIQEAARS
jgi:cell fate (sporulation/competence/biofilm development) regulator YlbF (YheA/YmcA/DUF963 family)